MAYFDHFTWLKSQGGGSSPYDGPYGGALHERGILFMPQVYERVRISLIEVCERVGKSSVI